MRITFIISFLLSLLTHVKAQENCPQGYEQRNVKCNDKIVIKCVPVNYSCSVCWTIEWQKCDGNWNGGKAWHSSYEKCLEDGENTKNGNLYHSCPESMNKFVYRIYINDSKFCSTTPNSNVSLRKDLLNKIVPFLKRYRAEIENLKREIQGKPYQPGGTFEEYKSMVKQGDENANNLEILSNNINDNNLAEIERAFTDMQNEEPKLIQAQTDIKNVINTEANENQRQLEKDHKNQLQLNNNAANESRKQQQLQELNNTIAQNKTIPQNSPTVLSILSDAIVSYAVNKSIKEDEANMRKHSQELQEQVKNQNGDLVDCSHCDGKGVNKCTECNGKGYKDCPYCNGTGEINGIQQRQNCAACSGKGKSLCISCNGLGVTQCRYCYGVGKEFKENNNYNLTDNNISSNSDYNTNNNRSNVSNIVTNESSLISIDKPETDFTVTSIDGTSITLSSFKGKKILLIFWSSLNETSIKEYKRISEDENDLKRKGITLIGIGMEFSKFQWKAAITDNNLKGIQISEFQGDDSDVSESFDASKSFPSIFFIDPSGTIKYKAGNYDDIKLKLN